MRLWNGTLIAAVVILFSAFALATSTGDPGGIIRSGSGYPDPAIIGPGLILTYDNEPVGSFNPYQVDFCYWVAATNTAPAGQQCDFINESGQTIDNVSQIFAASADALNEIGGLSCVNEINPEAGCSTPGGNGLFFPGLGIPSESIGLLAASLIDNGDPEFNILYFGFDNNQDLATIASTNFNVPEPASLALLIPGILSLGLGRLRKRKATGQGRKPAISRA